MPLENAHDGGKGFFPDGHLVRHEVACAFRDLGLPGCLIGFDDSLQGVEQRRQRGEAQELPHSHKPRGCQGFAWGGGEVLQLQGGQLVLQAATTLSARCCPRLQEAALDRSPQQGGPLPKHHALRAAAALTLLALLAAAGVRLHWCEGVALLQPQADHRHKGLEGGHLLHGGQAAGGNLGGLELGQLPLCKADGRESVCSLLAGGCQGLPQGLQLGVQDG
mmetsp:Transcript_21408/g.59424  ORF Transcript_21408/g.59424 Transcript_21408/m.59424 type:complete len:220 (+) Transcript_21408:1568-2227(+)